MNSGLVIKTNKPHEGSEVSVNGRLSIAMFCIVVKVSLYLFVSIFLQHSSARTANSHVAQLDDQRGGIL